MRVFKSYITGIRDATLQPKMVWVLWLMNVLFGTVVFYLFYGRLSKALGPSALSESLMRTFDYNFLFEFLTYHGQALQTIFAAAFILIGFYFLVSLFLYGGILSTLSRPDQKSFAAGFFQGAGRFFGRFFRLAVYSILLWLAFVIFMFLLNRIVHVMTANRGNEQLMFTIFLIQAAVGLFLIYLIRMILDYARIIIVSEDSRHVFLSLWKTIRFIFKNLGKTLSLYYLLLVTGGVLFVGYWVLKSLIPSHSLFAIFLVFIVCQLFIASRAWLKVAFQSAQLTLYSLEPF
jgi:hypothetical protein